MNPVNSSRRIWELDLMRGIAILLMVIFHFIYDLNEFYSMPIAYEQGLFYYVGKAAACLFILIAGISCSLSRSNFKRGIKLLALGFLITITTAIAVPGSNIIFGILHFLGASILLFILFRNVKPAPLFVLGSLIIIAGYYIDNVEMPNNLLAPLGLLSNDFFSVDYYPLVPWFGLFLYGVTLGKLLYQEKKSYLPRPLAGNPLVSLGRYSLSIYLLHQPVILLLLYLFLKL